MLNRGACRCGALGFSVKLTQALADYSEESASPRLLEPGEKAERWASIWMPTELPFRGKA